MKKIKIFDTTLRDGEQSPGCSMTIDDKVRVAKQLERLNVDVIEAGFAASSKSDKIAIEKISQEVSKPVITSLARCVKSDIDIASEALKDAKKSRIHTFIATSDIHMKYKLHMNRDEVLKHVLGMVSYASSLVKDVEFSCEDATRSELKFLYEVIECAIKAGANVINIPDTVGYFVPEEYKKLVRNIKSNVQSINNIELSCHCHNDLGLAVANSIAGVEAGINQVECTINGIGERAGNASLEEIVAILNTRKDYFKYQTQINCKEIYNSSKLVCDVTGSYVQYNKPVVGNNAFKHEAGIHQHGVLNSRETYEIMKPEDYGVCSDNIVIGIHSGKHAIIDKMLILNYDIESYNIDDILDDIKSYFSVNKQLTDNMFNDIIQRHKVNQKKLINK